MIQRFAAPIGRKEILALPERYLKSEAVMEVSRVERELANYLSVKHVLAFDSGRTSLLMALRALNLNRGDEVIVPAYTCGIVFEVVLRAELVPIFVDARPGTFNIDPTPVSKSITPKTKAIIAVHMFGYF